jgi:hypothetical protein
MLSKFWSKRSALSYLRLALISDRDVEAPEVTIQCRKIDFKVDG